MSCNFDVITSPVGGKWNDPVLPVEKVDNVPGNEAPFMKNSPVKLGTVPQKNHKVMFPGNCP